MRHRPSWDDAGDQARTQTAEAPPAPWWRTTCGACPWRGAATPGPMEAEASLGLHTIAEHGANLLAAEAPPDALDLL